jgi:hypothetical protein
VGEGARAVREPARPLPRLVDPVDGLVLAVALVEVQVELQLACDFAAGRLHVGQHLMAVDVRLTLAEQVQIGAVKEVE